MLPLRYRIFLALLPAHVRHEHEQELRDGLLAERPGVLAVALDMLRASVSANRDILRQDLAQGLRQLHRAPAFVIVASVTLALGIGGNVAFFTLVDGVLVRQLPFAGADRLVDITEANVARGMGNFGMSPADFRDVARDTTLFTAASVYQTRSATAHMDEVRENVRYASVGADFFRVFTDRPIIGRTLRPEDEVPGATTIVLSRTFWTHAFGGDPRVLERQLDVDGTLLRIVGVMPDRFDFPAPGMAFWRPIGFTNSDWARRGARSVRVIARLRPGVATSAAAAMADRTAKTLSEVSPRTNRGWSIQVRDLLSARVGGVRTGLLLAWGSGALALLIAVANVASLLVTRAVAREREFAVRLALGARMHRIVRQLTTEALVVAVIGTAGGLGVATFALSGVRSLAAAFVPRSDEVVLDSRALAYAVVLAVLTTTALGVIAAWSLRGNGSLIAVGSARSSASRRRRGLHRAIVGGEAALAAFVLFGGALIVRTLTALLSQPMGLDPHDALTFRIEPPARVAISTSGSSFDAGIASDRARVAERFDALMARLRALPDVQFAGAVNRLPLTGDWWTTSVHIPDAPVPDSDAVAVYVRPVTGAYFDALKTRVLRGRGIERSDVAGGERVVVIDAEFARRSWGGIDAVGRDILLNGAPNQPLTRARVVGVAESVHMNRLDRALRPTMYVPFSQAEEGLDANWGMDVVVRSARGVPESELRSAVHDIFPDAAMFGLSTMDDIVAASIADRRFQLFVVGSFAALALVLTTVGVAGTFLLAVRERREELAVRSALGAAPAQLWWSVQKDGLLLTLRGALPGLVLALAGARLFSTVVYGVPARDPASAAGALVVLMLAAFIATAIPATRAMRTDPATAMRE